MGWGGDKGVGVRAKGGTLRVAAPGLVKEGKLLGVTGVHF